MTGHAGEPGELLAHDGVTEVWRVGLTVRRPCRPFTATVQSFLGHLRSQEIDFVPEPLGYDDEGREVLSFVEGDVPTDPLPDAVWAEGVLVALAGLIRRLHDAAEGWLPPADATWGSIPGQERVAVPALFDRPELVAHQDYCPGNVVFRCGLPAAVIDFDLARPTSRVADCVNAMYWWVPLLDPADRRPAAGDLDAGHRLRVFADGYGMSAAQRAQVVPVACQRARNSNVTMASAASADPIFGRCWTGGLRERTARSERWITVHADDLEAALA
ncbi:MAG: phosphotransferase [Acidimicrobiales bacterium]